MIYAYARCSINETDEEQSQLIRALQAAGAERAVFEYEENDLSEKVTLQMLLEYIRPGDTIVTTQISRLARSTKHLCEILHIVRHKRLRLIIIGSIEVDCRTGAPNAESAAFLKMATVFSELESQIASANVKAGMFRAKESGKAIGRPRTKVEDIPPCFLKYYPALEQGVLNKSQMAKVCGLSRPTVYKYLRMMKQEPDGIGMRIS